MRQYILVIAAIIFLISCKKTNDIAFQFSGTYVSDLNETVEPIILLTNNKKITDAAIILNFLKRKNLDAAFIIGNTSVAILPIYSQ